MERIKIMKKFWKLLMITAVLACVLAIPAFASDYDSAAQELKNLGLFQGTNAGFDLDRTPTRTEAAVMLVRLLGAETQAKTQFAEGKITHPFTDVPSWASPYIAWLYTNNLAKGVSDTAFGAAGQCTAKMYCTFVLRSLGYSDGAGGDFTFDSSEDMAINVGIYDSTFVDDTFLRDHAVFVSYEALATRLNNSGKTLLEKLVSDGAVSQESAKALLGKVKSYAGYFDAFYKWQNAQAMDMTMTLSTVLETPVLNSKVNVDAKYTSKTIVSGDSVMIESGTTFNDGDNTMTVTTWLKDGYLYTKSGSIKTKRAVDDDDIADLLYDEYAATEPPVFYLNQISDITAASTGAGTLYTVTVSNKSYNADELMYAIDDVDISDAVVNSCTIHVLVGNDGMISTIKENLVCTLTTEIDGKPVEMKCTVVMNGTVNATGSAVSIQFPNFSDYTLTE